MKRLKYIAICLIGIVIGFLTTIIVLKNQAFINVMYLVNWSVLTFWIILFLGATLPIILNYLSVKKQEVIKLKAKIAQDKIDILRAYKTFDSFMRITVILDKKVADLSFAYEPTYEDLSIPSLRGLFILESHERYSNWKIKNMGHIENLNGLGSNEISSYTCYMQHYIFNVDRIIENIPDDKMWEVSVAVKNDFSNISNEFTLITDKYLNYTLFKFKSDLSSMKDNIAKEDIEIKLNKTNLIKYKKQLIYLKGK